MSRLSELPSSFYITGGTLPPDSPSYISRAADDELFQRCLAGEFCYVLTSRQMGKSSLMARTAERLRKDADTTVAIVDLSQIGTETEQEKKSADRWYYGVARTIRRSLGIEHDLKAWWREREDLPSVQRLIEFFTDVVLTRTAGRVLIFVDEIDTTIGLPYSDDFFAAIRACYNARATEPELRRLGFVLLGVASPSDLIADVRRTPFNIGHRIELTDFNFEEAMPLAQALATAEAERARQLRRILHWTGGHPYLTQRICELLAAPGPSERCDEEIDRAVASAFFDPAANRDDPNLRFVRDRLTNYGRPRRDLLRLYERVYHGEVVKDAPILPTHGALKLSGAVVATTEGTLRVRNEIYRRLFTAEWARQAMPVEWKPRLTIAASVALLLGGLITWHWLVQPRNYMDALIRVQNDAGFAESTAAKLRGIFGYSGRADDLLANFWKRQAVAAEASEHRDEAILYRCRSLQAQDTNLGRRELNAIIQNDYPRLLRTLRHTSAVKGIIFSKGDRFLTWTQDAVQLWNAGKNPVSLGPQIRAGTGSKQELGTDAAGKRSAGTTEKPEGDYSGVKFDSVAFSSDGSKVLTGSNDSTARLWSAVDGSPIGWPLKHEGAVFAVAFSPDSSKVLTGSYDRTARLWNAADGSPIGQPLKHEGAVNAVAFSLDGSKVLTGSDDSTAQLWNAADGSPIGQPLKHEGPVNAVAFSLDGTKVLTSSDDRTVRLWSAVDGSPIGQPLKLDRDVNAVAFSPDGSKVLTSSYDRTARLWNAADGSPIGQPLKHHKGPVNAVAFSPDSSKVLTGSYDRTAQLWNAVDGSPIGQPLKLDGPVNAVAFSRDGTKVLTSGYDRTARLWSVADGSPIGQALKLDRDVNAVAFTSDGSKVLTSSDDSTAQLWNAADGSPIGQPLKHPRPINAVAFSLDGSKVLTGSDDSTAQLWNAADGSPIGQPLKHKGPVNAVAFSSDGSKVLTGSYDSTARLWSAVDGSPIGWPLNHEGPVFAVAFSPDGSKVLTGSYDSTARLWNAADGSPIGQPLKHEGAVNAVAFSLDGSKVLTGSNSTARLWNAADGSPIGQPLKHEGAVNAVAFSPGGSKVLTSSYDRTARLWNAADGSPIGQPLKYESLVRAVAFSPDGSKVMTSTDSWLHIFELRSEAMVAIASSLKTSPSSSAFFIEPSGKSIRIVSGVRSGRLAIATFEAGLPTTEPITGTSEALSRDWQRRLALQLTADGKIVPVPQ